MSEAQSVESCLDAIEELMESGTAVPLSGGKRMVDVNQMQEYIDQIRLCLPDEIRQAQGIVNDRSRIGEDARVQADAILHHAEEKAKVLVSEEAVTKAAQQRAAEIIATAQKEARELRRTVTDYCENMLRNTEETMIKQAGEIKTIRTSLRQTAKGSTNPQ